MCVCVLLDAITLISIGLEHRNIQILPDRFLTCLVFFDFFQVGYPLFKICLLLFLIVTMGIVSGFLRPTVFFF